ncbi:hypothetical protein ACIGO8_07955 [Streptomyces sp. NPDC053493]|uniref:hypothetical protein n=1 Tax=Streptomyces sp. NPDC053493 TaxID=3365705 RepID=UPI0037CDAD28
MALEIRPSDGSERRFDLIEGDDRIGEITFEPPDDEFAWTTEVWSLTDCRRTWIDCAASLEEARALARTFDAQLLEQRRQEPRGSVRAISTPMGGRRRT